MIKSILQLISFLGLIFMACMGLAEFTDFKDEPFSRALGLFAALFTGFLAYIIIYPID